jgi:hypothetical protein
MTDKARAQTLAAEALQIGAKTLRGPLQRESETGCWSIGRVKLSSWLGNYEGQELIVIVLPLESAGAARRVCRTCGREYEGAECPHCREVRHRLRGD